MPRKGERKDLLGMRFGKLVVESEAEPLMVEGGTKKRTYYRWNCVCDCGNRCIVRSQELLAGKTVSCGCYADESRRTNHRTHGLSNTRLYRVYTGIKTRCYNANDSYFESYGGRGIGMCDEWRNDFSKFAEWAAANGYDEDAETGECTIDRIDVDGDYSPENCRFVTMHEQQFNKTTTHYIEVNGERVSIAKAAEDCGLNPKTIYSRVYRGQDPTAELERTRRSK